MVREKISGIISRNKEKFRDLGIKLIMVSIIVFIGYMLASTVKNGENKTNSNSNKSVYNPKSTVLSGSKVEEKQYEKAVTLVDKFLEYCNEGNVELAYNLISDSCKKDKYSTIEKFKEYYYTPIFDKKRTYNLQAWISSTNYTVYKVRFANDMLSTGTFNSDNVYEDYITIQKKENEEKISIGAMIESTDLSIKTRTNEIEAEVINKKIYVESEEYTIKIKNITNDPLLLDELYKSGYIVLECEDGCTYNANINKLFISNLLIEPGKTKDITIVFKKNLSSEVKDKDIMFLKVIRNYNEYKTDKTNYKDTFNLKINVED